MSLFAGQATPRTEGCWIMRSGGEINLAEAQLPARHSRLRRQLSPLIRMLMLRSTNRQAGATGMALTGRTLSHSLNGWLLGTSRDFRHQESCE
ncbi:hypothetical protein I1E95_10800 [Synechococcus sp. CBW1107]|jgi:hypothetical protein|uniref:hypothetical protein n=1 Tax=Synechococcus sp. CBW1107 TaxID=2789857 RepID=UPI0018CFE6C5|nr:hypothetical protein [Synechococcus sp. CBW1107]QPN55674.1 hypothetical protein I1E95_10800 [Synechococcus sp. CBW1107]